MDVVNLTNSNIEIKFSMMLQHEIDLIMYAPTHYSLIYHSTLSTYANASSINTLENILIEIVVPGENWIFLKQNFKNDFLTFVCFNAAFLHLGNDDWHTNRTLSGKHLVFWTFYVSGKYISFWEVFLDIEVSIRKSRRIS